MSNQGNPISIPITDKNYHMNKFVHSHIEQFAESVKGDLLDIGCGEKPHEDWFDHVDNYVGIDIDKTNTDADVCGTATNLPFQDDSFDMIISTQVLEHLPDPSAFFDEVNRVLRSDGRGFITTNQMYPLHEEPNDYYRFTRYGLKYLANQSHLTIEKTIETGSLLMRVCCETNYVVDKLPQPLSEILKGLVNCAFSPVVELNHREEYIVTGVVVSLD